MAVTGAALVAPGTASAELLYGADGAGGGGSNTTSNLYVLNPSTGAVVRTVGPIGFAVTGLAQDPTNGALYGSTSTRSAGIKGGLIKIDPNTGAGTAIGDLFPASGNDNPAADIAFRSDGTLYGWIEDPSVSADDLAVIDKSTGAATIVSDSGVGTAGSGLAFSPTGTLYLTGKGQNGTLEIIDPATGQGTAGPTLNGPNDQDINALSFNGAGVMFGSTLDTMPPNRPSTLLTIDPTTGNVSAVGPSVDKLDAIEFFNPDNSFTAKLKGRVLSVTVKSPGTVAVADGGGKAKGAIASKKKKKKAKSLKPSSGTGGPGVINVKLRLTKSASTPLRQKGKLKVKSRVTFTPNDGKANSQVLKLKLKNKHKKK